MYQILVVDDEALVRKGIIESIDMENLGIDNIYEGESGKEALEYLEKNSIDVLITDIKMPEMDGIELMKYVRSKDKEMPIIVISGYSDFAYLQSAIRHGVNDYILKPIRSVDLNGMLETIFEKMEKNYMPLNQEVVLKESVLYRIISGTIGKQGAKEKLDNVGLALGRGKYQVCIIQTKEDCATGKLYQVTAQVEKILLKNKQGAAFVHPDGLVVVLLCRILDEKHIENVHEWVNERVKEHCNVESRVIAGAIVNEMEEIPFSYQSVMKRLQIISQGDEKECSKLVRDVKNYVWEHYMEKITLKEMADRFYVNASYMGYLFKNETGVLFNDYVNQHRVKRAKELLLNSNLKIYEIMDAVGIADSHYFVRIFKKYVGMSPSDYRKKQIE